MIAARILSSLASRSARFITLERSGALGRIHSGRPPGVHFLPTPDALWGKRGSRGGSGALGRIHSGRPPGVHFLPTPDALWGRRGSRGGGQPSSPALSLAYFFPGSGGAAPLERVG